MEHVVYLVALQNPNDLKKVRGHAQKIAKLMAKNNSDAVNFAALALANWKNDYGDLLCIGDNRRDSLVFYPIKEFSRHLIGFTYLPIETENNSSVFPAFYSFCSHEMRDGSGKSNENYNVVIIDFRKTPCNFVGNEADELVRSLEYNFGKRSKINLICRSENRPAYRRLEALLPGESKTGIGIIGERGENNPFSAAAVAALLN